MFKNARSFNQLIFGRTSDTNVDAGGGQPGYYPVATNPVTDMTSMFEDAYDYNQETRIDTGFVSTMVNMFRNTDSFNTALVETAGTAWDVSKVTDMTSMFEDAD